MLIKQVHFKRNFKERLSKHTKKVAININNEVNQNKITLQAKMLKMQKQYIEKKKKAVNYL